MLNLQIKACIATTKQEMIKQISPPRKQYSIKAALMIKFSLSDHTSWIATLELNLPSVAAQQNLYNCTE